MSEWLRKIGGKKRKERGRRKMYEGRKTWSERGRRENQEINLLKKTREKKFYAWRNLKKYMCVCNKGKKFRMGEKKR
jgi:hypothetical protein